MAKMAEMANNRQIVNKYQMRWQRDPFESSDFGKNGVFGGNGEQPPNC